MPPGPFSSTINHYCRLFENLQQQRLAIEPCHKVYEILYSCKSSGISASTSSSVNAPPPPLPSIARFPLMPLRSSTSGAVLAPSHSGCSSSTLSSTRGVGNLPLMLYWLIGKHSANHRINSLKGGQSVLRLSEDPDIPPLLSNPKSFTKDTGAFTPFRAPNLLQVCYPPYLALSQRKGR